MSKSKGLSPTEHLEVGRTLKRARQELLDAARLTRCYGKLSERLLDAADALPRAWLEERLVELVGADGVIDGVHVRYIYFGPEMEEGDG
jgi:hypothetical protein